MKTGQYATCAAAKSRCHHFCSGWSVSFWEHELPLQTRNGKRLWRPKLVRRDHELAQTKCKRCKCSSMQILQFCKALLHFPFFSRSKSSKTLREQLTWDSESSCHEFMIQGRGVQENVGAFCFADLVCWTTAH